MEKALHEWVKVNSSHGHRPFWPHIALFFRGNLTNKTWWAAQDLAEIFGLAPVQSYKRGGRQGGEIHLVKLTASSTCR